jgi:hypothetical protein
MALLFIGLSLTKTKPNPELYQNIQTSILRLHGKTYMTKITIHKQEPLVGELYMKYYQ